jgi:alkanesulfonate monooxygenase SsuD/methylene tetrahydromethanopterin reductase-like flavin-dependent oxidoreductase (luciferase family)
VTIEAVTIEIGVVLPTSTPDPARPILGDVRDAARLAEDLGLGSVWSTDHLVASAPILDSTVVLSTAAAVTERITIGFGVMLLALRPVAWAAKQISTLQYVSGGRVVLGVGTGNPAHGDAGWRAAGVPFEGRGRRTDEALRILPSLVAGEPTMLADGSTVTLAPGSKVPRIVVAGNGTSALRRAAEFGDGWACIGLTPDEVAAKRAILEGFAAPRGRKTPLATVVAPALDPDPSRAAAELAAYADVGVERVILAPSGVDWRQGYEYAATILSKMPSGS